MGRTLCYVRSGVHYPPEATFMSEEKCEASLGCRSDGRTYGTGIQINKVGEIIMKKWMTMLVVGMLTVGLVACGGEDASQPEHEQEPEPEEEHQDAVAAEDHINDPEVVNIFEKAIEAAKEINNAEVKLESEQLVEIPSQSMSLNMDMDFELRMSMDPYAIHQKGVVKGADPMDEDAEVEVEVYITDDAFYIYDTEFEQWLKTNEMEFVGTAVDAIEQSDTVQQLERIEQYAEEFEIEETDSEYIFTFIADGEKFHDLYQDILRKELLQDPSFQITEDESDILKNMDINQLDYEVVVDKETLYTTAINMNMDISFEIEGEELFQTQRMKATYSNINDIEPIEVPQDVIDSAVEL